MGPSGGGKSMRRRAKLAERANQGNLHKAARGKASAVMPLPDAPKREDYAERVPASLRRLMALKEVAAAQQQAKASKAQHASAGPSSAAQQQQQPVQQQQQHQQQQPQRKAQLPLAQRQQKRPAEASQAAGAAAAPAAAAVAAAPRGDLWEQPTRLKARRKAYLNAKKQKKKQKQRGAAPLADGEAAGTDRVAFGEVAAAPPSLTLKRRGHWGPGGNSGGGGGGGQGSDHEAAPPRPKKQQKRPRQQPQQQPAGGVDDALRDGLIAAYRQKHNPQPTVGAATLSSLKQLVRR